MDDLVKRLRADWPEILVEKHWMMDSDAIEEQRREAADRIEELEAELDRCRMAMAVMDNTVARQADFQTVVAYDCGIRAGQEEERAAIVAWLLEEEKDYPAGEYSVFVAMVRRELEAGKHRK